MDNNNLNNNEFNINIENLQNNENYYDDIILSFQNYNNNINIFDTIEMMLDDLKNNTNIFDIDNSDENNIQFNIEFEIIDHNNHSQDEDLNYFNSCKEINEKIGKSEKIKKNDIIIDENCLICMEKYKIQEFKRLLPKCKHFFHKKCIDKWLKKNASCPICRDNIK
jgi:hypothetical protein